MTRLTVTVFTGLMNLVFGATLISFVIVFDMFFSSEGRLCTTYLLKSYVRVVVVAVMVAPRTVSVARLPVLRPDFVPKLN